MLAIRVGAVMGADPTNWISLRQRGYTHNERWILRLADDRTAFVKAAVDEQTAA